MVEGLLFTGDEKKDDAEKFIRIRGKGGVIGIGLHTVIKIEIPAVPPSPLLSESQEQTAKKSLLDPLNSTLPFFF